MDRLSVFLLHLQIAAPDDKSGSPNQIGRCMSARGPKHTLAEGLRVRIDSQEGVWGLHRD